MKRNSVITFGIGFLLVMVAGCGGDSAQMVDSASAQERGRPLPHPGAPCFVGGVGAPAARTNNCFVIDLGPPVLPEDNPVQPDEIVGASGRYPSRPDHEFDELPEYLQGVEPTIIEVWHDPQVDAHPDDTHTHVDGPQSGTGHCHDWVRISTTSYIQVHC